MSPADVKAASIQVAIERDAAQSPKGKEKGEEKEVEQNGEMNNKESDKAESSAVTSVSSRKLPILTLTPAPVASTSTTHPKTRSRITQDTELVVDHSTLSAANVSEINVSEDSRTVSLPVPISPSPSPLLSP